MLVQKWGALEKLCATMNYSNFSAVELNERGGSILRFEGDAYISRDLETLAIKKVVFIEVFVGLGLHQYAIVG